MKKPKQKMMICPKAKECKDESSGLSCIHEVKHTHFLSCDRDTGDCPSCVEMKKVKEGE